MPRLILLTFALASLALPAQAELRLTGEAQMGLSHESGKTRAVAGTRLTATFSTVTDGGLELGAVIRIEDGFDGRQTGAGAGGGARLSPGYVYIGHGNPEPPGANRRKW